MSCFIFGVIAIFVMLIAAAPLFCIFLAEYF